MKQQAKDTKLYRLSDPYDPDTMAGAARRLDGKVMPIREAMTALRRGLNRNWFTIVFTRGCILLHYVPPKRGFPQHCWRMLRAKPGGRSRRN
jgi:hypothetical protein